MSSSKIDPRALTARPWSTTLVSNYILRHLPEGSILDFGCGRWAKQVQLFRDAGRDADGYDLWWEEHAPSLEGLYSSKNRPPRTYDILSLSNVLNIQRTAIELSETLQEARQYASSGGYAVANYPRSPRKLEWTSKEMARYILQRWDVSAVEAESVWIFGPL